MIDLREMKIQKSENISILTVKLTHIHPQLLQNCENILQLFNDIHEWYEISPISLHLKSHKSEITNKVNIV